MPKPPSLALTRANAIEQLHPDDRWALVIGVDDYSDPAITDLRYTANDARAIQQELVVSGAFPESHVILMTDDQADPALHPTRANILKKLAVLKSMENVELVFFYFSGHGLGNQDDGSGSRHNYLAPSDVVLAAPDDTALSVERVLEYLNAIPATRRIVVLDACRNQVASNTRAAATPWKEQKYALSSGMMVLYATQFGGYSYEDESLEMGVFTSFFVEGLKGKADSASDAPDGVVGADELYRYVQQRLQEHRLQTDQIQVPARGGDWSGQDFPLVLLPEPVVLPAPPEIVPVAEPVVPAPPEIVPVAEPVVPDSEPSLTPGISLKPGYRRLLGMNFVSYGLEFAPQFKALRLAFDASGSSTLRRWTESQLQAFADASGVSPSDVSPTSWQTILVFSLSPQYQFQGEQFKPYFGPELEVDWVSAEGAAFGVGVQGGLELELGSHVGLQLDATGSYLMGDILKYLVENPSPFAVSLSAGLVVSR